MASQRKGSHSARGAPRPARPSLMALAVATLAALALLARSADASRFRYGTLSWVPTSTIDTVNNKQEVEFTLRASFRRDFEWGAYYNEQWAQSLEGGAPTTWYGSEGELQEASAGFDRSLSQCTDQALNNVFTQNKCFNCPAGTTTGYFGCENTSPQFDLEASDSSGNGLASERFHLRFPARKQKDGVTDVVPCETPFHCDARKGTTDASSKQTTFTTDENTVASALCDDFANNAAKDPAKCAPWSELYGMFLGDGSTTTVDLEVVDMDANELGSSRLGNYITAVGTFSHSYTRETSDPFVAFFTGGERMFECNFPDAPLSTGGTCEGGLNVLMNNNAQGRYRLEVEVWLQGDGNRSPVVHQIPVMPIPHQMPGVRAKFQIAAHDPDGDALTFRLGNKFEMGGIVRSKSEAFPHLENAGLSGDARNNYDASGVILANLGVEYGQYECDASSKSVALTGKCPGDREPTEASGLSTHSFTSATPGLVEWNTWTDGSGAPCASSDGAGCSKLRSGFYNMVVMVSDGKVKVPADFMTYLYDGPLHFCGENCKANTAGLPAHANLNGLYGSQQCTICGYGEGNMTHTKCLPTSADGKCGVTQQTWNAQAKVLETSIVPSPTTSCKANTAPKFATSGLVNGVLNNPRLDMYEESVSKGAQQRPAITKYVAVFLLHQSAPSPSPPLFR